MKVNAVIKLLVPSCDLLRYFALVVKLCAPRKSARRCFFIDCRFHYEPPPRTRKEAGDAKSCVALHAPDTSLSEVSKVRSGDQLCQRIREHLRGWKKGKRIAIIRNMPALYRDIEFYPKEMTCLIQSYSGIQLRWSN